MEIKELEDKLDSYDAFKSTDDIHSRIDFDNDDHVVNDPTPMECVVKPQEKPKTLDEFSAIRKQESASASVKSTRSFSINRGSQATKTDSVRAHLKADVGKGKQLMGAVKKATIKKAEAPLKKKAMKCANCTNLLARGFSSANCPCHRR